MAEKKPKKKDDKPKKQRAEKYDEKLHITGSFEDLVKELITPNMPVQQNIRKK